MRIAYLLLDPGIGVFGTKGASVHVQEVARALRAEGHEVTVFATRTDSEIPADLADLDVRRFKLPSKENPEAREQSIARVSSQIAEAVRAGGFDAVYERYSLFSTAGAQAGVPMILEVNAPLIDEQGTHRTLIDAEEAVQATRDSFAAASVISCVSEPVANWTLTHGAEASRVVVTPNGVNTERIVPATRPVGSLAAADGTDAADGTGQVADAADGSREIAASPATPLTVGFVGTLKPWHGTDVLLHAVAAATQPMRLEIAGAGPELEALKALAKELGIEDRTVFHGAIAPELMPRILTRFDVATAPYPLAEDHYFSPLKVYEYLAAGLPTVASAIGAIPAILDEGRIGVLVEPGNVEALAAALDELAVNGARRAELAVAAREAAEQDHSWRSRVVDLLTLLAGSSTIDEGAGV